jgi:hypothetical protein
VFSLVRRKYCALAERNSPLFRRPFIDLPKRPLAEIEIGQDRVGRTFTTLELQLSSMTQIFMQSDDNVPPEFDAGQTSRYHPATRKS